MSLVTTLALVVSGAPGAQASPAAGWFWEWSDGSRARERVLHEVDHPIVTTMPALRVASSPAAPGRFVELQVRSGNDWLTEDSSRTDQSGSALVQVNPYCSDGGWCTGTMRYRLRVDGITASLSIRFTPQATSL
ncbi:MAG TPA: hypothetical protein DCQ36_03070 [Actinobacteria bacterium]|jgi:hypothetical protein|nr:hypothetical protein [Actinomycetota bacterium]